ncbi:MAG: flagellar assembly protein FliW [Armatimonadota bacterium]|nr:flagellar assembly protein FliW [Armatimonadota bacterium]
MYEHWDAGLPSIALTQSEDARILTTLTLPRDDGETTTNLLGPIVVNLVSNMALQVVAQDKGYTTKHITPGVGAEDAAELSLKAA